jgi:hypothetical protein
LDVYVLEQGYIIYNVTDQSSVGAKHIVGGWVKI